MYGTAQKAHDWKAYAVAVVASAGGVQALSDFVSQMPADVPASILIAQHMSQTAQSFLREILQRKSRMPVRWAETGRRIVPGRIYLAPPATHMRIGRSREIQLSSHEVSERYRPSGNILFRSVSESFGREAIGVVLTGCLNDGSSGARAIRAAGGRVFVQAPECCLFADMPAAAMQTGVVDLALPVRSLAAAITAIVTVPGASEVFKVGESYRQVLADSARAGAWRWDQHYNGLLS
jgi:two-component system chemotaxis response regulator CheB